MNDTSGDSSMGHASSELRQVIHLLRIVLLIVVILVAGVVASAYFSRGGRADSRLAAGISNEVRDSVDVDVCLRHYQARVSSAKQAVDDAGISQSQALADGLLASVDKDDVAYLKARERYEHITQVISLLRTSCRQAAQDYDEAVNLANVNVGQLLKTC